MPQSSAEIAGELMRELPTASVTEATLWIINRAGISHPDTIREIIRELTKLQSKPSPRVDDRDE